MQASRKPSRPGAAPQPARRPERSAPPVPRFSLPALLRAHQDAAVDSLARLLREGGASLLTALVIGIALALPLCFFLLLQNLQQIGAGVGDGARLSLFLQQGLEPARVEEVRRSLTGRNDLESVELISAEQALSEFRANSGFGEALEGLEENPLPAVLVVTPAQRAEASLQALQRDLQALPEVEQAQLDLQWVRRLQAILDLARRLTLGLAGLLGLGVMLAVGNTVRLVIEGRRDEIRVVKLVGGTDAYVARPFLYAGFWYGAGGGFAAWAVVQLGLLLLAGPAARLAGLYGGAFVPAGPGVSGFLLILLGGGLLGWMGAWLSVLRHLRAIEPK